jgi:hypothetical protein
MSKRVALVSAVLSLTGGPWASTSSFAQSWLKLGSNQEQDKVKAQQQAPLERAFSQDYWQLNEEQRALAAKQYNEFLRQPSEQPESTTSTPPSDKTDSTSSSSQIAPLKLPKNIFEVRPGKTSPNTVPKE